VTENVGIEYTNSTPTVNRDVCIPTPFLTNELAEPSARVKSSLAFAIQICCSIDRKVGVSFFCTWVSRCQSKSHAESHAQNASICDYIMVLDLLAQQRRASVVSPLLRDWDEAPH